MTNIFNDFLVSLNQKHLLAAERVPALASTEKPKKII